jgi:hypothetical protein
MAARVISQQEAMVELGCLPLVLCSETIQPVSISLNRRATGAQEGTKPSLSFIQKYASRNVIFHHMSLKEYFHQQHNSDDTNQCKTIPHFVGGSTYATYPITEQYARSMLYIYKPWNKLDPITATNYKHQFETFLQQDTCPLELKIIHEREKERQAHRQPTTREGEGDYQDAPDGSNSGIDELLHLAGLFNRSNEKHIDMEGIKVDKGLHYNWNTRHELDQELPPESDSWLLKQIEQDDIKKQSAGHNQVLTLKKNLQGKPLTFAEASDDQEEIIYRVMHKLKEWIHWDETEREDCDIFKPLRLTGKPRQSVYIIFVSTYLMPLHTSQY